MSSKEIVNMIKNYFEKKYNVKAKVNEEENSVEIEFENPVEMLEEEYDNEFYGFLRKLGFIPDNSWEERVVNTPNYKSYTGVDQYQSKDNEVIIYYDRVSVNERTLYYIKGMIIEGSEEN